MLTRREYLGLTLTAGAALALDPGILCAQATAMLTRPIPKTGERVPVIGVGTNNFGAQGEDEIAPRREVLRLMADSGASIVDTARGYGRGRAEEVIGQILRELTLRDRMLIATKVGTPSSRENAVEMLEASMGALGADRVWAMRAHSVDGAAILFPILREWKQAGRIKYFGSTTVNDRQYPEIERHIRDEGVDIIEIDYSVVNRGVAERVLPLAQDHGVAVMTATPFGGRRGNVLPSVTSRPLPDFAKAIGATSWAQICLKYNLSHPAVTVVIPGTTSPQHMMDNLGAGRGELPDADIRRRIERIFDELG
jgi:aryl-alcohol dehydrogenase-like predicted oxidoreductase